VTFVVHTMTCLFQYIWNDNLKNFDTARFTRLVLMMLYRVSSLSGQHSCFLFGGPGFQSGTWARLYWLGRSLVYVSPTTFLNNRPASNWVIKALIYSFKLII
jgi:hypothetical protein